MRSQGVTVRQRGELSVPSGLVEFKPPNLLRFADDRGAVRVSGPSGEFIIKGIRKPDESRGPRGHERLHEFYPGIFGTDVRRVGPDVERVRLANGRPGYKMTYWYGEPILWHTILWYDASTLAPFRLEDRGDTDPFSGAAINAIAHFSDFKIGVKLSTSRFGPAVKRR